VLFIVVSPVIGFVCGLFMSLLTAWIVRTQKPYRVDRWFRRLQLLSAGAYSLGNGTNDAQKGMGIITAALVSAGMLKDYKEIICAHLAFAGGTMAGGWRIIKTVG
jgi:PiT family inorganic phosphate transporter